MIIAAMSYTVHPSAQIPTTRKGSQAPGIPGAWPFTVYLLFDPGADCPGVLCYFAFTASRCYYASCSFFLRVGMTTSRAARLVTIAIIA